MNRQRGVDQHEGPRPNNVVLVSVTGSNCYGLNHDGYHDVDGKWHDPSDLDTRGVFVLPTKSILALRKPKDYVEQKKTDDKWFEIEKFFAMLAKGNAEANEMLNSPKLQFSDDVGDLLLKYRQRFVGKKKIVDAWGGYSVGQLRLIQRKINEGESPYKPAMHMLRLLYMGLETLETGVVNPVMTEHRDFLMSVRMGFVSLDDLKLLQADLLSQLNLAYEKSELPEEPDYDLMDKLLKKIRLMYL